MHSLNMYTIKLYEDYPNNWVWYQYTQLSLQHLESSQKLRQKSPIWLYFYDGDVLQNTVCLLFPPFSLTL